MTPTSTDSPTEARTPGRGAHTLRPCPVTAAPTAPASRVLPAGLLAVLLALLCSLATAGPAQAHDELLRTSPEADATLETAPKTLELTFSGAIQDIGSEVRVTDSDGTDMTRGTLAVQNTKVSQPLREGGDTDETYTVTWRVVSQDGHPIEGTFTYTVGEGSETTAGPAPVTSTSQAPEADDRAEDAQEKVSGTGIPTWVLPVIGGVVALILLLVVLTFITRPKQR